MREASTRLFLAVAVSAVVHTAALLPARVPTTPYISTPFAAEWLNVRLLPAPFRVAGTTVDAETSAPALTADAASSIGRPGAVSESLANRPAEPKEPGGNPRTGTQPSAATPAQPARERAAQGNATVRTALPDEVNVYVRRYDAKADDNPNETIELPSGKYFYFNAPQLRQAAHPLAVAAPQYPSRKLDYPHGAVILLLLIDEQGRIEKTMVECANPSFEESAIASVRDMRFAAARDASGPVKSYMKVEFHYGLGNPCGSPPLNLQQVINPRATR